MLSIKEKMRKEKTKIPFIRTNLHMNKRKNSLTPFFNKKYLIKTTIKRKKTRNSDNQISENIRMRNFTDLHLSIPSNSHKNFNPDMQDQQSSMISTQTQSWKLPGINQSCDFRRSLDISAMHSTFFSNEDSIDETAEYLNDNIDQSNVIY